MMPDLFSPIQLGDLTLNNRILMAPLTRNRAPEGIPTPLMEKYYRQRASSGLIISEGSQISPQAVGYPATPGIYSDAQAKGWQAVTDAVHDTGGRIYCQLWHCGRVSHPSYHDGALPVAPSAIRPDGQAFTLEGLQDFVMPRALEVAEIKDIVDQYVLAAANAIRGGFDGVEIHAANGYLIDQFLRDGSNQRSDQYGGSIENRTRFLLEVTQAVCEEIGAERVGIRISPVNAFNDMCDSEPQALFDYVATALSALKPVYLHVVEVSMVGADDSSVNMQQLRRCFDGCYIANGGYDKARGNQVLASYADMVAYGVPFLANPDLPARFLVDAELNAPDMDTFYGGDEKGYSDYPVMDI
ncbi:MAG: alkene reductase [Mariprofundaceae bacterium]|nr:alkene reductase [Mariprofundaceae bacterium]